MNAPTYLGVEGGGTRTVAILADAKFKQLARAELGPANIRLLSDHQLEFRLQEIAALAPAPSAIGIGMAGARGTDEQVRISGAVAKVWGTIPCKITHDLEIALNATDPVPGVAARILILSGTGSCCYGVNAGGAEAKVGGWGHMLGDKGSGYEIGLNAAKGVIHEFDRHGHWTSLGEAILRHLLLNQPADLIDWIQGAEKSAVASLAVPTFEAAAGKDRIARGVLAAAAASLVADARICARRLASPRQKVSFVLAGSVLLKQPSFANQVARQIRKFWPAAVVSTLAQEGAWGAVKMAAALPAGQRIVPRNGPRPIYFPEFIPGQSPTEQRNPKTRNLDRASISQVIEWMLDEEETIATALRREMRTIERAIRLSSEALRGGGRIFYAGAGTSGRLGVLDASECPPTFRVSADLVQGIMAGGQRALWQAMEGAEDDAAAGAAAVRFRGVRKQDVLIGIAASGRTPFVWGALRAAREVSARTILLHFNPALKIRRAERPNVVIAPNLGPEILTGSTRLKCGTATKLILNMITTISMVRLGKVVSNLMVDLNPSNVKLRDRAERIVQELTGCSAAAARSALEQNSWVIKAALRSLEAEPRA